MRKKGGGGGPQIIKLRTYLMKGPNIQNDTRELHEEIRAHSLKMCAPEGRTQ